MIELSGCIIEKEGKILLQHRIKENHWELPGGTIEKGETPEETAIREAQEEIGCDVELEDYLGYYDFELNENKLRNHQFKAKIISGEFKVNEPEVFDNIRYVDIKTTNLILAPNIVQKNKLLLKEKKVSLIFFYDENKRILLQDRRDRSKHGEEWGFFGGSIEEGETPKQAIVRETKEELDFDLKEFKYEGYFKNVASNLGIIFHTHIFSAPLRDNLSQFNQKEGRGMKLFSIEESLKLNKLSCDNRLLKKVEGYL